MSLPLAPPVAPMLARTAARVPAGAYAYEPKWDGFRCLVFRDGDTVDLQSRSKKSLTRYFPEVVELVRASSLPARCVLDGELVVVQGERLEFERLLDRIHPAESRVALLAEQTPARLVVFDLLCDGDEVLLEQPYERRRALLEERAASAGAGVHLTPATHDAAEAQRWFEQFEGAGLDGVVAKELASPYAPGKRTMLKVKHVRTADVVVAGYRLHTTSTDDRPLLGSMLLGLVDDDGVLQHVGVSSSFTATVRAELAERLAPLRIDLADHPWAPADDAHRRPGAQSRWNAGKDTGFVPLDPVLVAEVGYDHLEGDRFRHTTQLKRWRPDRDPASCTYAQLEEPVSYDLHDVLTGLPRD